MKRYILLGMISFYALSPWAFSKWFKGNTHTHTNYSSDGDSAPQTVVQWYQNHGYQFVVLTDHNTYTPINYGWNTKDFLVIAGEEITQWISDQKRSIAVHVNALGSKKEIPPYKLTPAGRLIQKNIQDVFRQNALAQINHPNFYFSLQAKDFLFLKPFLKTIKNPPLFFEVYNGSGETLNKGYQNQPSTDTLWDQVLSQNIVLYATATDDSHEFKTVLKNPARRSPPGMGWIFVDAPELSQKALFQAMKQGNFYASTGVSLKFLIRRYDLIGLWIAPEPNTHYWTLFIGKNGKILSSQEGTSAIYYPKGNEGYVRAKVISSRGKSAWIQPYFLNK